MRSWRRASRSLKKHLRGQRYEYEKKKETKKRSRRQAALERAEEQSAALLLRLSKGATIKALLRLYECSLKAFLRRSRGTSAQRYSYSLFKAHIKTSSESGTLSLFSLSLLRSLCAHTQTC